MIFKKLRQKTVAGQIDVISKPLLDIMGSNASWLEASSMTRDLTLFTKTKTISETMKTIR